MKAQFILEGEFIKTIRFLLGLAFQSLYFIFLYSVMPSKRLKFKSLLIGGLTASILFEILQYINIFLAKSAMSADPSKIYGTVPLIAILFFAWIRLSWIVALCGASVCLAAEKIFFLQKDVILEEYPAKDMIECVNIYCAISKLYKDTGQPVPIPRILAYSKVPLGESKKWISFLIQKEVLFSSLKDNILTYAPSYKALTGEKNTDEFLREVLFSNHSNVIRNYNDIEKHFNLCLKGNDIEN